MTIKRDFLTLKDYSASEIRQILDLAKDIKRNPEKYRITLENKELAMLFQKTSTRTRVSFEVGIHQLGGHSLYLDWRTTNFTLGDIRDEILCMSRYVDIIMARVYEHKDIENMAKAATIPVINGLSDKFHPCQALADMLTIEEQFPTINDKKIVFIGDGSNNVATSLIIICAKLGITITVISPEEFQPPKTLQDWLKQEQLNQYLVIESDPKVGVIGADVIYTDTFVSMGQENESTRRLKIFQSFQLNQELIELSGNSPIIMHCLPAHREVEITSEVLDSVKSVVFDQSENRLHTQKALMVFLFQ